MKINHGMTWALTFGALGLLTLLLFRPKPHFILPTYPQSVIDGRGERISIPDNAPIAAYSWEFLTETHRPDRLSGRSNRIRAMLRGFTDFMPTRIYRYVYDDDHYWHDASTLETMLKNNQDTIVVGATWFHNHAVSPAELRRLGIIALETGGIRAKDADTKIIQETQLYNELIAQPVFGQQQIHRYMQEMAQFHHDFKPPTNPDDCPRVLGVGAPSDDWSKVSIGGDENAPDTCRDDGSRDAAGRFRALGRQQDAERILAIDPDLIITSTDARKFMADPRWQGLKAVKTRHVYTTNPAFTGFSYNIDNRPFALRLNAEIIHPERMIPQVRSLLRAHYYDAYGYRLSDQEIDQLLSVPQNSQSAGSDRFSATSGMHSQ